MIMPVIAMAETYNQLWKSVDQALAKDQPKTVCLRLQEIVQKAEADREWGHLIKAELMIVDIQQQITPDSLQPQIERLEGVLHSKAADNPALEAVCNSVLGRIYQSLAGRSSFAGKYGVMSIDECMARSREYFAKSIADVDMLAKAKAAGYEPLMVQGDNSNIFGNDLLHVLCFEAKEYRRAADYYRSHGNDAAACMSVFYQIQKERFDDVREIHKSKYKARLDSLIHEYRYLPETGEVAIERFNFMDQATDASAQEKVEYIDYALRQWPTWPRMAVLRNARQRITLPSFHVQMPETVVVPDCPVKVNITSVINLQHLKMTVTKLNMTGAEEFDPNDEKDMKTIRSLMADKPLYVDSRDYYGLPDYKEVRDTMNIIPLPMGVYLVEFTTDNHDVPAERQLLHVSNLRLMDMDMPDKQVRLIAVNATTGKPVSGARITLQFRQWKSRKYHTTEEVLTTESNGEVTFSSTQTPFRFRVSTTSDKAMPWRSISTSWQEKRVADANNIPSQTAQVYTDRAIYRPKQTVEASVLYYENDFYGGESKVFEQQPLKVTLFDNRNKEVESVNVKTDAWGVANVSFTLPEVESTGMFSIRVARADEKNIISRRYIRVEEYKRPTFVVNIDDYDKPYKAGDTITVRGWAKTYAGVPVQNAKVVYHAKARTASWWLRYFDGDFNNDETYADEVTTADDGSFEMRLPIVMKEGFGTHKYVFSECGLNVTVTSLSGESHDAQRYFAVSNKTMALLLDGFDEKQCLENLQQPTFRVVNNAGTPVEKTVTYRIDEGEGIETVANQKTVIDFSRLEKGEHMLRVYCENDSIEQKFVLFSLDDERPVITTDAWYYDTPGSYKGMFNFTEGEPVRMQLGTSCMDQTVFYAIISEKEILEEGSLVLNNENLNRSFIYKEEWGDGIALRYSWARNGKVYTFAERLHRPVKSQTLELEWTTFRDKLRPGQNEEWTIRVKDADGNPAAAHMIATIYDKSLEMLAQHSLPLNLSTYSFTPNIFTSQRNVSSEVFLYGEQRWRPQDEPQLSFYRMEVPEFDEFGFSVLYETMVVGASPKLMKAAKPMAAENAKVYDVVENVSELSSDMSEASARSAGVTEAEESFDDVQIRENLNETAAFLPTLVTDKNGNVSVKFTLPEALTTWRFLGLAHDKQLRNGNISGEAISQKPLMVQPNMSRFLREGDKTTILATVTNTTDKTLSGSATLQLINAETEKVAYQSSTAFTAEADNTTSVAFDIPSTLVPQMYVCKVVAKTKTASDGEQQYLPVLSKSELITTTRAITQVKAGKKTVDLDELFGRDTKNEKVTIEYTNNPAWMMVDALPAVISDCDESDNAVSYSSALYAATIVRDLKLQGINADVVVDSIEAKIAKFTEKLKKLQNEDGSFSWYPQMPGNAYITLEVVRNLVRLDNMLGAQASNTDIINEAMKYLAEEIADEVSDLKKMKAKSENILPSELAMDYLYIQALRDVKLGHANAENVHYLLDLLRDASAGLTIYGKSNLAVAFARLKDGGDRKKAEELLESAMQYSVSTELMGRYFDTPKAQLSWRNYKIPTETAVIEAMQILRPADSQSVAEMRQWLLNEKRTQKWDTPINSSAAIYAFLNGNLSALDDVAEPARIYLDGKMLQTSGKERGSFKKTEEGRHHKVVFDKRQDGMSFGAVTTMAMQPVDVVTEIDNNGLHVKREIISADKELHVGDKVTVRITLSAERDMDFVEVEDNKAACLESVNQISGYRYGAYISPRDTKTCYYVCHLAKGRPVVIDTEYYVDRSGEFVSGLLTARCAYAPEFSARAAVMNINVEKK